MTIRVNARPHVHATATGARGSWIELSGLLDRHQADGHGQILASHVVAVVAGSARGRRRGDDPDRVGDVVAGTDDRGVSDGDGYHVQLVSETHARRGRDTPCVRAARQRGPAVPREREEERGKSVEATARGHRREAGPACAKSEAVHSTPLHSALI